MKIKHTKSQSTSNALGHATGLNITAKMAPLFKYKTLVSEPESPRTPLAPMLESTPPPPITPPSADESAALATPSIRPVTEPGSAPLTITTSTSQLRPKSAKSASSPVSALGPGTLPFAHRTVKDKEAEKQQKKAGGGPEKEPQKVLVYHEDAGDVVPPSPAESLYRNLRPGGGSRRSPSQEKNFFNKFRSKGRDAIQKGGTEAFDSIKHGAMNIIGRLGTKSSAGGPARSTSPYKDDPRRDVSRDVDVFNMDLREATEKTRIVKFRQSPGDPAFWLPALAYRCIQ